MGGKQRGGANRVGGIEWGANREGRGQVERVGGEQSRGRIGRVGGKNSPPGRVKHTVQVGGGVPTLIPPPPPFRVWPCSSRHVRRGLWGPPPPPAAALIHSWPSNVWPQPLAARDPPTAAPPTVDPCRLLILGGGGHLGLPPPPTAGLDPFWTLLICPPPLFHLGGGLCAPLWQGGLLALLFFYPFFPVGGGWGAGGGGLPAPPSPPPSPKSLFQ